jgi:hypothetical protein
MDEPEADRDLLIKYVYARLAEAPALAHRFTRTNGGAHRPRETYQRLVRWVDDFLDGKRENRFIVLSGLRGVGKTTLLFQIYTYLNKTRGISRDRLFYFSTDELTAFVGAGIKDAIDIFIQEVHGTTPATLEKDLFILIDEAHYDKTWSMAGKVIYDQSRKVFLIFTGSSALNLELNVDASRRTKKETVFPMGFLEYLLLKHNIHPPEKTSKSLLELILRPGPATLKSASQKEQDMKRKTLKIGRPLEKEFQDFLLYGDLPFALPLTETDTHQRIFDMINRVIEKDVFSLKSFSTQTRDTIIRVLTFLALQKPGGTSDAKLAGRLKTSPTLIRNILNILEKTHLVFSIKPYGSGGKLVRKPWKYYFQSPSINAAIRYKLGAYDRKDRETLGVLVENLVASYLFRMKETSNMPAGIFYDPGKQGVDFLLLSGDGGIIPIEVGAGAKKEGQIKRAIRRYGSTHGVIISDTEKIVFKDGVVHVPVTTFSWAF